MEEPDEELEVLFASWQTCKSQDEQKNTVIQALFTRVGNLKDSLKQMERSLKEEQMLKNLYRKDLDDARSSNRSLVQAKERHSFALALVDGDCMLFQDEFIKCGFDGGRRAAQSLKQAIKSLLDESADGGKDSRLQVVVRVYANLEGLAKVYKDAGNMDFPSTSVDEFVRGFNMLDPLCDFIDAGNGKECADEKVKAVFRLNLDDVHCQHIFFGGSADNGYARLLGQYVGDDAVCGRITLLQGPPFAHEIALIRNRFRVVAMDGVFRKEKLQCINRKPPSYTTPPTAPSSDCASIAGSAAAKPTSVAAADSSAAVTKKKAPPQATAAVPPSGDSSAAPLGAVRKNRDGQRVDMPVKCSAKGLAKAMSRHYCHSFHLLGECPWLDKFGNCNNKHGEPIYGSWRCALQAVARLSPCDRGLSCADPKCLSGHNCTKPGCSGTGCRFSPEMHNVDVTPV